MFRQKQFKHKGNKRKQKLRIIWYYFRYIFYLIQLENSVKTMKAGFPMQKNTKQTNQYLVKAQ